MKKLVSMVCTLALLVSVSIPAFAASNDNGNSQIISALEQGFRIGNYTYTLPSTTINEATTYLNAHPVATDKASGVVTIIGTARDYVRTELAQSSNPDRDLKHFSKEEKKNIGGLLLAGASAAYPEGNVPDTKLSDDGSAVVITETDGSSIRIPIPTLDVTHHSDNDDDDDEDEDNSKPSNPVPTPSNPSQTFTSDTTSNIAINGSYQFKITSKNGKAPTFVVGTPGVFEIVSVTNNGSDYFFKLKAIGAPGDKAGIYVNNGQRLLVATVGSNPNYAKLDTGKQLTVKAGKTYQFKVTAAKKPTFACGTGSTFRVTYAGSKGNDYFFKVTATGKVGDKAGFYVNGEKAPRTIGTVA
jgi:hypothetical protein